MVLRCYHSADRGWKWLWSLWYLLLCSFWWCWVRFIISCGFDFFFFVQNLFLLFESLFLLHVCLFFVSRFPFRLFTCLHFYSLLIAKVSYQVIRSEPCFPWETSWLLDTQVIGACRYDDFPLVLFAWILMGTLLCYMTFNKMHNSGFVLT